MLALLAVFSIVAFYKLDAFNIGLWIAFIVILFLYLARVRARKAKN